MTKGDDMGCLGNMTAVEKLMALAADWEDRSCGLYVHLREGSEGRWGVNWLSHGSVSEILREIADRALEEQADLKMFAERVRGMLWADGWHDLDEIADRLEEELSELDRMRCKMPDEQDVICDDDYYDGEVHPVDDEDYAAAMWVREHGGVEGLKARMLPDGMEWPAFENGEKVRIGDEVECRTEGVFAVGSVTLRDDCFALNASRYDKGERVRRPAHKALDADGVEIRVGDTVYKVGGDGTAYVFDGMSDNVDGLAMLHHDDKPYIGTGLHVDQLTHERPESWKRLEDDAGKNPFDYCKDVGHRLDTCENSEAYKARDLVRRCKALAERERRGA